MRLYLNFDLEIKLSNSVFYEDEDVRLITGSGADRVSGGQSGGSPDEKSIPP